ncbi:cell division protein FtsL [Primorskyibacter aestuariivivens]|uniref:cell division protein FtsL n=1 Tax=Primorskyibacter aestuariivivens TaxID=1888912 RepID=UPI002301F553|nr:cell division protein FtsL [Primorskyibacter aestuariivivens]MDA7427495.1 cell division protein FtsL [Primorskyibacter aestuariivivens]
MKFFLYLVTATMLIGLAFWAYHENYKTQQAIEETEQLQREIGAARERLSVLRAEWAYLNRPDRLRDLAELNFTRLGLLPLRPDHFGRVDQVAFPTQVFDTDLPITTPVDVSSQGAEE